MTIRAELKRRAKAALHRSYWAMIAVCFILAFVAGEYGEATAGIQAKVDGGSSYALVREQLDGQDIWVMEGESNSPVERTAAGLFNLISAQSNWLIRFFAGGLYIVGAFLLLFFRFLVAHPLQVGGRRFFLVARHNKAEAFELGYALRRGKYLRVVGTMFLRYLYTMLWTLLLLVPGIIKAYEYRMVPYLLAEDDALTHREVFHRSRALMRGNKWRLFVQDLSFLGWRLLSGITLGILGIFLVNPYMSATEAEFYADLRNGEVTTRG